MRAGSDAHVTCYGYMQARAYNNISDARLKKDIQECKINAIKLIKDGKVYNYKFKDTNKEEFGLVIGEGYKCPQEIVDKNDEIYSINSYRMASILWKAIQEQQEQIEQLQKEIKELKGEK